MQKNLILTITLTSLLTGCGSWSFPRVPGVYKIDIQQGNVIEQNMVDTLRPGMSKRQVRFVMGTPLLIDPFEADRWDYVYSFQPGGGKRTQEQVSLFFDDNKLTHFTGHYRPTPNIPAENGDTGEREVTPEELMEQGSEEEEEDNSFLFLKF